MFVSSMVTFIVYWASIILMREYFDTSYITVQFCLKVVIITLLSWLPLHLIQWVVQKVDPTEQQKILKQEYH